MAWDYNISKAGGDRLHSLIQESDGSEASMAQILEQIQVCCQEITHRMAGKDDSEDFEELHSLMEGEAQSCRDNDLTLIREYGYDSFEELVDSRLSDFYDLCDSHRVWLGIGSTSQDGPSPQEPQHGGMGL